MQKHILVVSFIPPGPGTGASPILQRHLQRLEKNGWQISVAVPELLLRGAHHLPSTWQVIPLSSRQWWWPPIRPQLPITLELRLPLWRLECEQALGNCRPSAILTPLWGMYPRFAAYLSQYWDVPLSVIVHDQEELWTESEAIRQRIRKCSKKVLNQAARVWPVTEELGNAYPIKNPQKISPLVPIPEGKIRDFVQWKSHFQTAPVVAYAGTLYAYQIHNFKKLAHALDKVNGTLLIVTWEHNPILLELQKSCSNVKHHELFQHNEEVIHYLASNATGLVVSYTFSLSKQPWARTSFPSKFVEFSHLGLPTLILSPRLTPLANWAESHNWLGYTSNLDDNNLLKLVTALTIEQSWLAMAEQSQKAALTEFNPNVIQSQFEAELATTYARQTELNSRELEISVKNHLKLSDKRH